MGVLLLTWHLYFVSCAVLGRSLFEEFILEIVMIHVDSM